MTPRAPASGGEAPADGRPPARDLDVERAHARAKLKARLFQIESEPLRIGRFPILGRLGQGGMGTVFTAYDEELDRKIAIKVMLPGQGSDSTRGRERMRREAQAMARLSHPNIVAVHEVGEVDEQVFIAMEFVRGASLDAWLAKGPRPWREVLAVFRQAGQGLDAAHAVGLVHRDFKPSNVMVGDDGRIKVLDFGLARASAEAEAETTPTRSSSDDLGRSLTRTGAVVGTPAFMAPEQLLGQPATARSDQFSFCVALYLALYGQRPFAGDAMHELVDAVCEGRVLEPPRDSSVPAWVRRVVLRGLARDPQGRYPSVAALLDALAEDPGARRRRWLVRLGALAVLFGGGFMVAQLLEAQPCPDAWQALRSAWNDERKARAAAALRGGSPHGDDTWSRVEPALEAYAQAWVASQDEACRAHRAGDSSDLLYERRVACLSRSRSALDALVEVFEAADASVADKAVSAVAGLPALARCEDAEALLAEVQLPPEAIAPQVAALREQLARARSMEDAGRVVESVALAEQVLARAEPLEYLPLVAEALLRRGSGQLIAGQGPEADDSLGRAAFVAIEGGHDAVAAEAAARRIYVRGEQLGRPAEAELELPWARALVDHTHDDALQGLLLNNAAVVKNRAGDPRAARELVRRALEVKQGFLPAEHPEIALTLANLGRIERDLGDYTLAVEALGDAARVAEIALGPRHPQRALIGTMLGTTLLERGQYAQAGIELARADAIVRESLGEQAMPRYHVLKATGELARRERRWADAREALEQALAIAEPQVGAQHPMLAEARLTLAEVAAARGEPDAARTTGRAAVEQLEGALGTHLYVGSAWLRFGRMLLTLGDTDQARSALARALEIQRALPSPAPQDVAWTELWLAHAQAVSGEPAAAISALEQSLGALAEQFPEDGPHLVEARDVLAVARLALGQHAQAVALLARNEAILGSVRPPDDPELAWLRARLAHVQHALVTDATERTQARVQLERALAVLEAHAGYEAEAADARTWLEALAP